MDDLNITLILQKGRFFLINLDKRERVWSDTLPRYGKIINTSFLETV